MVEAGLLDDVWEFDAEFFGISPREAEQIDPQQRLLLQAGWEALEDSGAAVADVDPDRIGVYVGGSSMDFANLGGLDPLFPDTHFMTGSTLSILANRLSNAIGAAGPSMTVDTACSSSLHALAQAEQALEAGRVDLAVVGGVSVVSSPYSFVGFSQAQMLSPSGRCRAFGENPDGYVRGEGVVVFVLARDGLFDDRARGRLLAVELSSDGRKTSLAVPSVEGQSRVLEAAMARGGVAAEDLSFVEAHGTGTQVGDPIEAEALGRVLGQARSAPLPIGSVKSNIGHLEPASGVAGMLKALLALEQRRLPQSLFTETLNPIIEFERLNLDVAQSPRALTATGRRVAGVNSFGFGGTNAHVLIEALDPVAPDPAAPAAEFITLTAASRERLSASAEAHAARIEAGSAADARRLAAAAARRRPALGHRLTVPLGGAPAAIAAALRAAAEAGDVAAARAGETQRPLAFAFSGNGSQWAGMGVLERRADPDFDARLEQIDGVLSHDAGFSVIEAMEADDLADRLRATSVAQPLLFALQAAAADRLKALGLRPAYCFGHSVGEIAAAYAAGAVSLERAARLVVARSRLQEAARGLGRMAVLGLGESDARAALQAEGYDDLDVAGVNSSRNVTLAGAEDRLAAFGAAARARRWLFRELDLEYPFHSRLLDAFKAEFLDALDFAPEAVDQRAVFLSTVAGDALAPEALTAEYWWRNLRDTVRFADGARRAARLGVEAVVEIGPRPVLQSYLRDGFSAVGASGATLVAFEGPAAETPTAELSSSAPVSSSAPASPGSESEAGLARGALLRAAAKVLSHGAAHDVDCVYGQDPIGRVDDAPRTEWRPRDSAGEARRVLKKLAMETPLLGWRVGDDPLTFEIDLDPETHPFLREHRVAGQIVFPGAGFLEMAFAAAVRALDEPTAILRNFQILGALIFEPGRPQRVRTRVAPDLRSLVIESRPYDDPAAAWTRHLRTRFAPDPGAARPLPPLLDQADRAPSRSWSAERIYELGRARELEYGPSFALAQTVEKLGADAYRFVLNAAGAPSGDALGLDADVEQLHIHPALFDAVLHGVLAGLDDPDWDVDRKLPYVPVHIAEIRAPSGRAAGMVAAHARIRRASKYAVLGDLQLLDANGVALATVTGLRLRASAFRPAEHPLDLVMCERAVEVDSLDRAAARRPAHAAAHAALAEIATQDAPESSDGWRLLESAALRGALDLAATPAGGAAPAVLARHEALAAALAASGFAAPREDLAPDEAVEPETSAPTEAFAAARDALPPLDELLAAAVAEDPDCAGSAALLARVAAEPELTSPLAPALVQQHLLVHPEAERRRAAVRAALERIVAAWPERRPLALCLTGFGAPSAAAELLQAAAPLGDRCAVLLLAEDQRVAAGAQTRFARDPRVAVALREPAWPRAASARPGGPDGPFDLIVDLGAARVSPSAKSVRAALKPGGAVLLAAPRPSFFDDLVFGAEPDGDAQTLTPRAVAAAIEARQGSAQEGGSQGFDAFARAELDGAGALIYAVRPAPTVEAPEVQAPEVQAPEVEARSDEARAEYADGIGEAPSWRPIGAPERWPDWFPTAEREPDPNGVETLAANPARPNGASGPSAALAPILAQIADWLRDPGRAARRLAVVLPEPTTDAERARAEPAELALRAFARTAANEYPDETILVLRADARASFEIRLAAALAALAEREEPVATDDALRAGRLVAAAPVERAADEGEARILTVPRRGRLEGLAWESRLRAAPGPGAVEVEIAAGGLNFRDVMWAMGLLPEEALEDGFSGPTLGFEASGVIARVGEGVASVRPGDKVLLFGAELFATHATVPESAVTRLPDTVDPLRAAAAPVAQMTARYALQELARLREGEWVLIHGAAGGVGLAALQIAREVGAKAIATAGSPEKRAFLRSLGADMVANSRDMSYVDAALEATDGAGVDVVLNSLAGRDMERSLELLKPFGRFCELGKRDYYEDSDLGLRAFRMNLSYFGVDLDQILAHRDIGDSVARLSRGLAEATPDFAAQRVYPAAAAEEAFRAMQRSEHLGKILIRPPERSERAPAAPSDGRWALDADAAHLVVGGTGGFGLAAAQWLVSRGARKLCLMSRGGVKPGPAEAAVADLRAEGVAVEIACGDAADPTALDAALAQARAMGPLRTVLHAATVFEDHLIADLSEDEYRAVLGPKADAAELLDSLTVGDPIDRFILFSSATTLLGNPGQSNYVAANAYLEGVARRRRRRGLPALAPAWGAIADAGVLTRNEAASAQLQSRLGDAMVTASDALDALEAYALDADDGSPQAAVPVIGRFDWRRAFRELPLLTQARFDALGAAFRRRGDELDAAELRRRIAEIGPEAAADELVLMLRRELSEVLRMPNDEVPVDRSLAELGLDSLMAVELRTAIEDRYGFEIPISMMTQNATMAGIALQIVRRIDGAEGDGATVGEAGGVADAQKALAARHLDADAQAAVLEAAEGAHSRAAE